MTQRAATQGGAATTGAFDRETFKRATREQSREAVWGEIGQALTELDGPEGFVALCDMLVVSGKRS